METETQLPAVKRFDLFNYDSLDEALKVAAIVAKSDFCPKCFKGKPSDVLLALEYGKELKIAPLQALQNIAVINGKPSIYGDLALAIVKCHHLFEWCEETLVGEGDNRKAIFKIKRKGEPEVISTFSVEDAIAAGLWDTREFIQKYDDKTNKFVAIKNPAPWYRYPNRMLKFRARGFGLRDSFPDALKGLITDEEARDYPTPERFMGEVQRTDPIHPSANENKTNSENKSSNKDEKIQSEPNPHIKDGLDTTIVIDDNLLTVHSDFKFKLSQSQSLQELKSTYEKAQEIFKNIPKLLSEINNETNKRKRKINDELKKIQDDYVARINAQRPDQKNPGDNLDVDLDDGWDYSQIEADEIREREKKEFLESEIP